MIEELLLWLWLFLRVSGFVQQVNQLDALRLSSFLQKKRRKNNTNLRASY
jgi:hypothetical protein